jgi:hypothetical protein
MTFCEAFAAHGMARLFRHSPRVTIPLDDLLIGACALERGYAVATETKAFICVYPCESVAEIEFFSILLGIHVTSGRWLG